MTRTLLAAAILLSTCPVFAQGGRRGPDDAPQEGTAAPDFELHRLTEDGTESAETVKLSELCQTKPVALVFGSYT